MINQAEGVTLVRRVIGEEAYDAWKAQEPGLDRRIVEAYQNALRQKEALVSMGLTGVIARERIAKPLCREVNFQNLDAFVVALVLYDAASNEVVNDEVRAQAEIALKIMKDRSYNTAPLRRMH